MNNNYYVYQRKDYGIGNFINCTPTLQALFRHYRTPIPVYFESKVVQDMFGDAPFITAINKYQKDGYEQLFTSGLVNQKIPDYKFIFDEIMIKRLKLHPKIAGEIPHTYVDRCSAPEEYRNTKYAVIARGGVNNEFVQDKDPGREIYKYIIGKLESFGLKVIVIGSDNDKTRIDEIKEDNPGCIFELNDVRKSIGLISGSHLMVTNDTGMCHAAGALKKRAFVLWKDTNFNKNRSPGHGKQMVYSIAGKGIENREEVWAKEFDEWYSNYISMGEA